MLKFNEFPPVPGSVELTPMAINEVAEMKSSSLTLLKIKAYGIGAFAADLLISNEVSPVTAYVIGSELSEQMPVFSEIVSTSIAQDAFGRGFVNHISKVEQGVVNV